LKIRRVKFRLSPYLLLITGLTIGCLAVVEQGVFNLQPPVGQGICLVSHPYNLVNWISNNLFSSNFSVSSIFSAIPTLLPLGVIIGSFVAAVSNKEFKIRRGPVRNNFTAFLLGLLVINFGLLWGGCPIGTAVMASYGMVFAMVILVVLAVGVIAGCEYIKWSVRKT
jgi:hypothetical protein